VRLHRHNNQKIQRRDYKSKRKRPKITQNYLRFILQQNISFLSGKSLQQKQIFYCRKINTVQKLAAYGLALQYRLTIFSRQVPCKRDYRGWLNKGRKSLDKSSVADPGYLSRIPDPDFYPSRIPDPGSRIPDPGSKNR
jgi:hypothetical protein